MICLDNEVTVFIFLYAVVLQYNTLGLRHKIWLLNLIFGIVHSYGYAGKYSECYERP